MKLFFFYYNFTTTAIQSKHIYEDEIQAGLQLRLNLADQLDQDFTKSGISSADHPDMSDSGKIQAKKSDGPMIEAQLDRLRSVDINIDSGKTQAAWGDASDDLMSLCKVYNGALIFRVYVGTVTSVPSITGKYLSEGAAREWSTVVIFIVIFIS